MMHNKTEFRAGNKPSQSNSVHSITFLGLIHPPNPVLPPVLEICYCCVTVTGPTACLIRGGMTGSYDVTSSANEVPGGGQC